MPPQNGLHFCIISCSPLSSIQLVGTGNLTNRTAYRVNERLDHTLGLAMSVNAVHAPRGLRSHRGQHIVAGRQADKEGKRNQPDAEAKVRCNHGKGRDVGIVVVCSAVIRLDLGIGKVAEPYVMVEQDEA